MPKQLYIPARRFWGVPRGRELRLSWQSRSAHPRRLGGPPRARAAPECSAAYNWGVMQVLGVTGNIGSGKSTVCLLLTELGCPVVDADLVAHQVYRRGSRTWRQVVETFGTRVVQENGAIDRTWLGALVFADIRAREQLNAIVHPATRRSVQRRLALLRRQGYAWAAIEATLLIEAGWLDMVDRLWVVAAPEDAVVARLERERSMDAAEVRLRLSAQMPASAKMERAHDIVYNDGDRDDLALRVRQLWNALPGRQLSAPD